LSERTSWSRKIQALGHTVRLMPPSYVKANLKRSKSDANDAAAICEAVTRPSMRFVPTKSNIVSCAAVSGGSPMSATRFLSRRFVNRSRADTSGPLRKLSSLAVRRASSGSSSGGNKFLCARRSQKILSRSLSLLSCLPPYLEGQGHWSDLWISSIRA
jgi:hypothetical protein